jgi:hypothetical protein
MRHILFCLITAYNNFATTGIDSRTDLPTALFGVVAWLLDFLTDVMEELALHAIEVDHGADVGEIAATMSCYFRTWQ